MERNYFNMQEDIGNKIEVYDLIDSSDEDSNTAIEKEVLDLEDGTTGIKFKIQQERNYFNMQEDIGNKIEVYDLIDSSDEDSNTAIEKEVLDLEDGTTGIKFKIQQEISKAEGESSGTQPSVVRKFRNFDKSLDKALEEIKKGGSLVTIAHRYQIPEDVLYQKIVSRILPKEMDILTTTQDNNLVKWILKSNRKNLLVFKNQVMERVGRLKKVSKITPIFAKSKFGRMWYTYFLDSHPEIYEDDGLIMPSYSTNKDYNQSSSQWPYDEEDVKPDRQIFEAKSVRIKEEDPTEQLLSLGIKEAVVVLHDFKKEKNSPIHFSDKENTSLKPRKDEYKKGSDNTEHDMCVVEDKPLKSYQEKAVVEIKNEESDEINISNHLELDSKAENNEEKHNKLLTSVCNKCNKTFCNKYKLKRHLFTHRPKELFNFSCNMCFRKFPSKYHFSVHLQLTHNKSLYGCKECDKIFKYKSSLRNHRRKTHLNLTFQSCSLNFTCEICRKTFKYKNSLAAHIIYGHLQGVKKFSCDICKKSFIKHSLMMRHRLTHSKNKPLSCFYCQKTFSRKYLLKEHVDFCYMNEKRKIKMKCDQICEEYLESVVLD